MPRSIARPAAEDRPAAPDSTTDAVANDSTAPTEAAPQVRTTAIASPDIPPAPDARDARIRARAYGRAQARGFAAGHDLDDWLAAEAEESGDETRDTPR